ncbi:MAG: molybdenum cofactor biosynthesis protein MoaE [Gemmatimonadetes bacterium]|nr:molybdenum cofactor biosynthesis protein MoaE [Gemmatimonadota bacterium]
MHVSLGDSPLDEARLTTFVGTPASGAVVSFAGVVRDHHEGRSVLRIEYSAAEPLALAKLADVAREGLALPGVHRVAVAHRIGLLEVGEASVIVAASAAHRADAFAAARLLIDRIKEIVPVWKREHFADGAREWAPGFSVAEADRGVGRPEEVRES